MPEQRKGILHADSEEIATFEAEVGRFRSGEWDPNAFIGYWTMLGVYGQR
jgi:hypothetical protein